MSKIFGCYFDNISGGTYSNFDKLLEWKSYQVQSYPAQKTQEAPLGNYVLPEFPPCDCWLDTDTDLLHLNFALAGYDKKDVHVRSSSGQLSITATGSNVFENKKLHSIHHGIKSKDVNVNIGIDKAFDPNSAKVKLSEGILEISIPKAKGNETKQLL